VGVFIGPSLRGARVGVLVATRSIEPGQVLAKSDIALSTRPGSRQGEYAAAPSGHIAIHAIPKGAPIHTDDVGPDAATTLGMNLTMVPVDAPAADSLGGILRVGDAVRIIAQTGGGRKLSFPGIVLEVRPLLTNRGLRLAVLMPRNAADDYVGLGAKTNVTVVRDVSLAEAP
jgi:hypothetical protein